MGGGVGAGEWWSRVGEGGEVAMAGWGKVGRGGYVGGAMWGCCHGSRGSWTPGALQCVPPWLYMHEGQALCMSWSVTCVYTHAHMVCVRLNSKEALVACLVKSAPSAWLEVDRSDQRTQVEVSSRWSAGSWQVPASPCSSWSWLLFSCQGVSHVSKACNLFKGQPHPLVCICICFQSVQKPAPYVCKTRRGPECCALGVRWPSLECVSCCVSQCEVRGRGVPMMSQ